MPPEGVERRGRFILAIDQGTTNSKVSLVDEQGQVYKETSCPVGIVYPQPGWVEQDPSELWRTVQQAVEGVLQAEDLKRLAGLAVTNQRESALLWDRKTGLPLGPCVTWQCQRSAPLCHKLREQGLERTITQKTGLAVEPMFSAGKARWLLDAIPNGRQRAENGELCFGTVDAWLLWNLTGGAVHACDVTNASRTQLFNLHTLAWDEELCQIFGIPRILLPEVRLSASIYGETAGVVAIPDGTPIGSMIGDSHAALFGHAAFQPGAVKATYGTGSSLMAPTQNLIFSHQGLSTSVAWGNKQVTYALEGNIYASGAAVDWLCKLLGIEPTERVEELARQVESSEGVYFVPALTGLGAPYWKDNVRGTITGITRGTGAAQLARATLEAVAYQVRAVFEVMRVEAGEPLNVLLVDGGATRNDLLMQFQADILDVPVLRSRVSDVSALGAAYLAGLSLGMWSTEPEISALHRPHDRFEPGTGVTRREQLYSGWKEAVARTLFEP